MKRFSWSAIFLSLCACLLLAASDAANATAIHILALGASNTNGVGVSTSEAWPAQLESMLRKKGYDATVTVNAINGQTSAQVLARAHVYIQPGTQVVVFDNGGNNDRKRGMSMAETRANDAQIFATIRAHGAVPIRAPYGRIAGEMDSARPGYQADGHHLTAQSHARVAAALVPMVIAAIRKSGTLSSKGQAGRDGCGADGCGDEPPAAVRKACSPDARRFCLSVITDPPARKLCLEKHRSQLSSACRAASMAAGLGTRHARTAPAGETSR